MKVDPRRIPQRERLILAGLFLSKFDTSALEALGFESFIEAFNVLGYGLGGRPASIKNYRDEFDPLFPNSRRGWHKRPRRDYCLAVAAKYKDWGISQFSELVRSFVGTPSGNEDESGDESSFGPDAFAKRVATGRAAEEYFRMVQPSLREFHGCEIENTTLLGCGYDFRIWPPEAAEFLAVEVKGLTEAKGSIALTSKEYDVANRLSDRYFLFVVKNFRDRPFHEMHSNPLSLNLGFERRERTVVQVSWHVRV